MSCRGNSIKVYYFYLSLLERYWILFKNRKLYMCNQTHCICIYLSKILCKLSQNISKTKKYNITKEKGHNNNRKYNLTITTEVKPNISVKSKKIILIRHWLYKLNCNNTVKYIYIICDYWKEWGCSV